MLSRIARWLFQLPTKLFMRVFRNRLTTLIFFMLIASGILVAKRYLYIRQQEEKYVVLAAPQSYAIGRALPLREARGRCGGPLHDNQGFPWPASATYLHQPKRQTDEQIRPLTLDNRHNDFAVLVKLEKPVTQQRADAVFIPAASRFDIKVAPAKKYIVKIKDLKSGCSYRSSPFTLQGRWLALKLSARGAMQYQTITDAEF